MTKALDIIPIPAFDDNYIWLMHDGQDAIVIDPGDSAPVIDYLSAHQLTLKAILITHHHADHINGVAILQQQYSPLVTYAPNNPKYTFAHTIVYEPNNFAFSLGNHAESFTIDIIDVPGHTLDHIAYFVTHQGQHSLFCGDTLFAAGCGRIFEGTPAQMLNSLQKLTALPSDTAVYCTHEYTMNNIDFALTVEPGNQALQKRATDTAAMRAAGLPSLPSSIALELLTNPFLRCDQPNLMQTTLQNPTALQLFTEIRSLKDHF